MSEQPVPKVRRRILRNLLLSFLAFCVVALGLLAWWVTTDSFQQRMRRRVIAALEEATGGRVELGELHTIPFRLRVDARNLTIHGREAADQAPFVQVERVQAEMKIISLFEKSIGLHSLVLERPVVHVIAYPDGTTNVPAPAVQLSSDRSAIEHLMSLSVARIEAHDGTLLWQDRKVPFDFAAGDLALLLDFSILRQHYEARLRAGSVKTNWGSLGEFTWSGDADVVLARHHAEIGRLTAKSGHSEIDFKGRLEDYRDPQITGEYHGVIDLHELATVIREPHLRQGTTQFAGKGSWNLRTFAMEGTLDAKELEWTDGKTVSLRNGRAQAAFSIDPVRFRIPSLKASLLGGNVAGDVDVTNWQNSLESLAPVAGAPRAPNREPPSLRRVHLRTCNVARYICNLLAFPLAPALDVLSTPACRSIASASPEMRAARSIWHGSGRFAMPKRVRSLKSPHRGGWHRMKSR